MLRGSSGDIWIDECTDRGTWDWQDGRFLHFETPFRWKTQYDESAQLEAGYECIYSLIPSDASDYEKIKYVYEHIIDLGLDYDANGIDTQNIRVCLLYQKSVYVQAIPRHFSIS